MSSVHVPASVRGSADPSAIRLRLRTPGDLLALVTFLLGFHPRDSLVVVCTEPGTGTGTRTDKPGRLGLTIRVDLPAAGHLKPLCRQLVRTLRAQRPGGVMLLVVSDRPGADPPCRDVVDQLAEFLAEVSVPVQARVWAAELVEGARWCCYDECACSGVLDDPAASPLAAAAVAAGQVTYSDRSAMELLVAPGEQATLGRRAALLEAAIDAAVLDGELAGVQAAQRDLAAVLSAVGAVGEAQPVLGDEEVVRLAVALSDPRVRDACLALSVGEQAGAAEQLWTALCREMPDPEAAEPATLLAVAAIMRGNGGLANVALERAQAAWPGHRLSALVDAAIQAGTHPDSLAVWIMDAARDARGQLGLDPEKAPGEPFSRPPGAPDAPA
jgi:hypothetical protein